MSEEILINVNVDGERELTNVVKGVENLGKKTNKTQTELQKLRNELKQQKNVMLQAEEGTEEYGRALAKASDIQQRMTDVNKQVRAGMKGVGEMATQTASIVAGMGGGFSALTGVMNLFGVENEEVLKSIQRLQAVMAITSGLATFVDSIDAMQEFMGSLRASTAMASGEIDNMKKPVTELSTVAGEASDNLGNMGKEAAVLGSNLAGVQTITQSLSDANERFGNALKNNKELDRLREEAFKLNDELSNLTEGTEEYISKETELYDVTTKMTDIVENESGVIVEDTLAKKGATEATEKLGDATKSTGSALLKTIGTMVLLTAAITAVFIVIEKLIEYINKIPEEVKLKFELEESIIKDTQKAMEEIAQIRQNITLTSNKKELDLIKDKLVAEGIATEEQLKGLNDSKALLNAAFWDEYIENVKLVAENEYLIRKDIELRLQKELAQMRVEELRKTQTYLQGFASIFGLGELPKAINEVKDLTKEIETFQKTFYQNGNLKLNPVKFDIKPASTPKGGPKSPVIEQLYPLLTQKQIDDYIKDLAERTNKAIEKEFAPGSKQQEKDKLLKSLGGLAGQLTPEQLDKQYEEILKKRQKFIEDERNTFERQMELYMSYADSLASLSDSFVGIYDARMQVVDNYYNAEARLIENSLMTEDVKNQRLAELDQERYNKQKKLFEQQKKWQIATVMLNLASGLMNAYTRATLPVPLGGSPSPFNWIEAGLATAALIGQSVASIAQINAQQLEAPSTGGASASTPNVSIMNPNKTSLTTKEENLNMIQQSNRSESQSVVRVSDINEVQNKVSVRNSNAQF